MGFALLHLSLATDKLDDNTPALVTRVVAASSTHTPVTVEAVLMIGTTPSADKAVGPTREVATGRCRITQARKMVDRFR